MAFQQKTLELFDTVNGILDEYDGPLTLRQIFYRLVAVHYIENTQRAYKNLSQRLTDARRAGLVDPNRIVDRTRQTLEVSTWADLEGFLEVVSESYRREKWSSQQTNVEVWCEKDAVAGVLEPITKEFEVVLYPCRGYNSYSALLEAARRIAGRPPLPLDHPLSIKAHNEATTTGHDIAVFLDSALGTNLGQYVPQTEVPEPTEPFLPQPTTILYFGDFDPSGQDMSRDIRDRLRGDFGVGVDLQVIALTPEQIEEFDLPPAPAKKTDSRAADFIAKYGDAVVELDALPPDELQRLVRESVQQFVAKTTFESERAAEAEEVEELQRIIGEL